MNVLSIDEHHVSNQPSELRAHPRHEVQLEVCASCESNFYLGFTENLSEGGLFMATFALQPVGASIDLTLCLPDGGEPVQLSGFVRWVRDYSPSSNVSPGMGIQFDCLDDMTATRIRYFLVQRAPLFYDD
jgi:uncharacterized protein (TIGR02266 family)